MKVIGFLLKVGLAIFVVLIVLGILLADSKEFAMTETGPSWYNKDKNEYTAIPVNPASYFELDNEVGCSSTYNEQKKDDIFESKYDNHWMVMSGEIVNLNDDYVEFNTDGKGLSDVNVYFENPASAYDLEVGQRIKVGFVMMSAGGCFLPFVGKNAMIVE